MATQRTLINDMTRGNVMKQLIRFSLPLMAANALQTGFNLVDMFFVGQFAGTEALSAVTIAGQLTMLMFSVFFGIATSGQIYMAQAVGAGARRDINDIIGNVITMSIVGGGVLMVIIPLARPVLTLMKTPESIMDQTIEYLVILSAINILVALYNGLSGILRGLGDSTSPTFFVAVATVVNIVLDYLFVAVFRWGSGGAAWATLIGQSSACVFAIVYLFKKREAFGFDFKLSSLIPKWRHMSVLLRIAAPVTAKSLFISLSMLFVNAQINGLGVLAVAVTGVSHKIQSLMLIVSNSMNDAAATLVGQNMGAGKLDRVKRTVWCATAFGAVFAAVLVALFLAFPTQIFSLFTNDPAVIAMARPFMMVAALTVVAFGTMAPYLGLINGVGNTMLNMFIALADGVIARIALSLRFGYALNMGALGFVLGNCLAGFVSVIGGGAYFLSGAWKKRAPMVSAGEGNG